MTSEADKCVIVIDEQLPLPMAVNASSVLGVTLGHRIERIIGPDVVDGSGNVHLGFVRIPIPILKASAAALKELWRQAKSMPTVLVVDLTETGQKARTYPDYQAGLASTSGEDLSYVALALYGSRKSINRLTGNLPLLK
jgi:hypothetical protein